MQEVDRIDSFRRCLKSHFPKHKIIARQHLLIVTQDSINAILQFKWNANPHLACSAMLYDTQGLVSCSDKIWTVEDLEEYLASQ